MYVYILYMCYICKAYVDTLESLHIHLRHREAVVTRELTLSVQFYH